MVLIRLLLTMIYLWVLPFLLGMGALLLFEKKINLAKAWVLGYLFHTALFSFVVRLGFYRGWSIHRFVVLWFAFSLVLLLISVIILTHYTRKRETGTNGLKELPWKRFALSIIGVILSVGVLHVFVTGPDGSRMIAQTTEIYRSGNPMIMDYNPYTGAFEGNLVSGTITRADAFLMSYYACISTIVGIAPSLVMRFVISSLVVFATLCFLWLIADELWTENEKAKKWMILGFVALEITLLFVKRAEELQLLSYTWCGEVSWNYILIPGLLYLFINAQRGLLIVQQGNEKRMFFWTVIELICWLFAFLFAGSMWRSHVKLLMIVWLGAFGVSWLIRRYIVRDRVA